MLQWMCEHNRKEDTWDKVEVTLVVDKMREARLRSFRHVKRCLNVSVRRYERLAMGGFKRGRDRPKKYRGEVIRQEIK